MFEEIVLQGKKTLEESIVNETGKVRTSREKVEKMVEIEINFIKRYRDLFLVYLGCAAKKPLSSVVINFILSDGIKDGEFRKDLDIETASMSLFWMTAMVSLNLKNADQNEIKKMILNGIAG